MREEKPTFAQRERRSPPVAALVLVIGALSPLWVKKGLFAGGLRGGRAKV